MTDKTVYADPNIPAVAGKEAIQKLHQVYFDLYDFQFGMPVADVQVSGNLGVARGTWTQKLTPKTEGLATISDTGSWTGVLKHQSDGSWKWDSVIANSDRPMPGTTAEGTEEKALIQIQKDWANALLKSDFAALDRFTAKEWTYNSDGQVMSRAQSIAESKSGAMKITSLELKDLSPQVFGNVAVVTMTVAIKGKYKGIDIPGPTRSTDFFVKHDGRWQAVSTQNITIK
jgi:ketosteroid isomerase-like protein